MRVPKGNIMQMLNWPAFETLDHLRRLQGLGFDALGFGPSESESESVFTGPGVDLKRFRTRSRVGPLLVLVPAPIKRSYIFDLAPEVSVVRHCVKSGARVFLLEWQPASADAGLAEFGDRLILDCLQTLGEDRPILVAHSLGGLLAAIFAALHPERIRGLVLIASPLHFGPGAGAFERMVADVDLEGLPDFVPGSFLSTMSAHASPETFVWARSLDFVSSVPDGGMLRNHLRVERWTLDELAMPRRLFADLVGFIVREDRFVRGNLSVSGKVAAPSRISVPVLGVVDPRCSVVPPQALQPFFDAVGSSDKSLLEYQSEAGVCLQHVGPLVGTQAHAQLWPEILRWIDKRWSKTPHASEAGAIDHP